MTEPVASQALSPAELQRSASRGALWTLAHVTLAIPVAFVANAIVARSLGPADYGRLAIVTLVMSIAVTASNFGVGEAIQQWGAAAHARGDSDQVDRLLRSSLGFHLLAQLPILVVAALVLTHDQPLAVKIAVLVTAVVGPSLGSSSLCISIENRTAQASRLAMITNLVTQVAISAAAALTHSPVAVWATRSVIPTSAIAANFALLTPHRRRVALQTRLPRGMPQGFWRFSLFTAMAGLLGLLVTSRSEIAVLEWRGTTEDVGLYALAFGVAVQMRAPVEALLAPLLPSVAGIVEAHPELVPVTMLRSLRIGALFAGGLLMTVPFVTTLLPVVYGKDFSAATVLLPALAVVALSQALANPLVAFARAQKLGGPVLASNAAALTVDLAVAVVLIPIWGVWGAVIATATAQATGLAAMAFLQVRQSLISWPAVLSSTVPFGVAGLINIIVLGAIASGASGAEQLMFGIAGVLVWIVSLRLGLPQDVRNDLARIPGAMPKRLRRLSEWALSLIGVRRQAASDMTDDPGGETK